MRIIELAAENHRSFRDSFRLDMRRPGFRRILPPDGKTWDDVLYPTAAIFGANASGKSNVITALAYIQAALENSSGSWLNRDAMIRDPFRLQRSAREGTSSYALTFLLPDDLTESNAGGRLRRFHYEFELSPVGVTRELLRVYYSSRPTTLIDRTLKEDGTTAVKLASGLGGKISVSKRELVLSRAAVLEIPPLSIICKSIIDGADVVPVSEAERRSRLQSLVNDLSDNSISLAEVIALASVADLGIRTVSIDQREVPEEFLAQLRAHWEETSHSSPENRKAEDEGEWRELSEDILKRLFRTLRFTHAGAEDEDAYLPLEAQSDGTMAWLALGSAILRSLRNGSALLVDEIDTSLHTNLTREVIELFNDKDINRHGAQLIFTTHDAGLISPQSNLLDDNQIWLTEKDAQGASELFNLGDFENLRRKSNREKQYLEGRFGAVPSLAFCLFSSLLADECDVNSPSERTEQ